MQALGHHFDFYIITSDRDLGDMVPYTGIVTDQWIKRDGLVRVWYSSPGTLTISKIRRLVKDLGPDTIYFNSMFSRPFTIWPIRALRSSGYRGRQILAPRGMLQAGAMQRKALKKQLFLRLFRIFGWQTGVQFHATDQQESDDIRFYFPGSQVTIAENIPNIAPDQWTPALKVAGELRCVFISRIHPKKNLHYLLEILAQSSLPGKVWLDVYGEADHKEYTLTCKELAAKAPANIDIQFKGPLPNEQVFTTLRQYHIFALPTLGENFGHAIFEALSTGKPVLISDKTPWRELSSKMAGWDLALDNKKAYEQALIQVLQMDQAVYNEWSKGASDYAGQFVSTFDYLSKYTALFK